MREMTIKISVEPEADSTGWSLGDDSGPAPEEDFTAGSAMSVDIDPPPPEDDATTAITGVEAAADEAGPAPSELEAGEGDAVADTSAPPPRELDEFDNGEGDVVEAGEGPPDPEPLADTE